MSKLSDLKDSMIIKDDTGLCMGEVWHNERMDMLFDGVKSNKFNLDLLNWVKEQITEHYRENELGKITMHSSDNLTKTQLKKINAICKAKSKDTLQKRIYALSHLFTNSMYSQIFCKSRNKSWIEFCNNHNLDSGLEVRNRYVDYENELNRLLQAM